MRMDRDRTGEGPIITGIVGRGFRVDEGVYEGLIVTPERADGWTPPAVDVLAVDDLAGVLALDPLPEFVILGTGSRMLRPPLALVKALDARGIGIEPMDSRAAARAWGVLRAELRWVAAALYPLD
ncbi:MTH938/NDUFAF3 family protein [Sphingomonas sp. S1-29]|uniref:Mth938-like domain-containing protein n=1 Tax=Sphingomonas sp. S1-29 TaxID=2991074 RepID=UPI00224028B2|nr:MTH938/NDUFAF3 family protein [Sphingomonas sp. S1-29]UZK68037.1 MTH938/NDUFAF3 family protein [Sphingomonas sp. S1-29]